jgi:hypothetical protein
MGDPQSKTETFIRLLRYYGFEMNGLDQCELDEIANSTKPIMPPIDNGTPEGVFAFRTSFKKTFGECGDELDWPLIREAARSMSAEKAKQDDDRKQAREVTDLHLGEKLPKGGLIRRCF